MTTKNSTKVVERKLLHFNTYFNRRKMRKKHYTGHFLYIIHVKHLFLPLLTFVNNSEAKFGAFYTFYTRLTLPDYKLFLANYLNHLLCVINCAISTSLLLSSCRRFCGPPSDDNGDDLASI